MLVFLRVTFEGLVPFSVGSGLRDTISLTSIFSTAPTIALTTSETLRPRSFDARIIFSVFSAFS